MSCHVFAIKCRDTHDVSWLTTAHEDEIVEAPLSREGHHKIKPNTVLNYIKYMSDVDRSNQMSYYLFERKTIKWWKKLFFHLFHLVIVNAHILHTKPQRKISVAGTKIQVKGQTRSPAGRIVGRNHFLHRSPVTHGKLEGKRQRSCHMCAKRSIRPGKPWRNALQHTAEMRCRALYRAVFWNVSHKTALLGVTVIFIFSGSATNP